VAKKILALVLMAMMAVSMFTFATADSGKADLRMFFWFDVTDLGDWQKTIDDFKAEHPEINVVIEGASWTEYWTKLQTQATSGSVADVFGMVSMYSQDYINNGVTLGLGDLMAAENFDPSGYYEAIMSAYSDGKQYHCLPYDMSTELLLVNKDILSQCGVDFKADGYTMDEFMDAMKKIKDGGFYGINMQPKDWAYYDIMTRAGNTLIDENGKLNLNQEGVIKTTQWMADLVKDGYMPIVSPDLDLFASGKLAMTMVNPEGVAMYTKTMKASLDVIPYPTDVADGKCVAEGGAWAVYSGTKHPKEAWELLKALTSSKNAVEMVGASHRGIPPTTDKASKESMVNSPYAVEHSQRYIDMLANSTRVDYPHRTEVETEMAATLSLIFAGEVSAADGLAEFQATADEIMAQ